MIGAGIFTTSGLLMADLRNPMLMLVLWFAGGLIAMAGALCYGEVGATIPKAGGEYAFLSKIYHPMLGFLSGWVSFMVGFSAPIAASSIGFSEYFFRAAPAFFSWELIGIEGMKKIFSVLIIVTFTTIHLFGTKFGTKVQNYLTMLKLGLIVTLVVFGFFFGAGDIGHISKGTPISLDFTNWKVMGLSLMWIMFSYSGWNASTYIGSEIKDPKRNLPRSLIIGTGVVILLYLLLNLLFIYALSPEDMEGVIAVGGLAIGHLFGTSTDRVFSLFISVALFSSISAFIILGPRVYYAMAREGHFFKFAANVGERHKVPTYSIIFQGVISVIILLSGTLDQIFTYMGFSLSIFPLLVAASLFKLRRQKLSALKLPGFPFTPIFFILSGVCILGLAYFERPVESTIAVLTVALGIPAYYFFKRKHKKSV